jgi:ubiquinone/menaquinone biosynthesis C-methylase UbiE
VKTSSEKEIRELYRESAESYARMMDSEINQPYYADTLGRLAERIAHLPGLVIDTSCGSGHMLARYHERYDPSRPLLGIDLSPHMVAIAGSSLGSSATVRTGDMREMEQVDTGSAVAVLSSFAIHHSGPLDIITALKEWHRVLRSGSN